MRTLTKCLNKTGFIALANSHCAINKLVGELQWFLMKASGKWIIAWNSHQSNLKIDKVMLCVQGHWLKLTHQCNGHIWLHISMNVKCIMPIAIPSQCLLMRIISKVDMKALIWFGLSRLLCCCPFKRCCKKVVWICTTCATAQNFSQFAINCEWTVATNKKIRFSLG